MKLTVGQGAIELVQGDITQQPTDAIVNAANPELADAGAPGPHEHAGSRAAAAGRLAPTLRVGTGEKAARL